MGGCNATLDGLPRGINALYRDGGTFNSRLGENSGNVALRVIWKQGKSHPMINRNHGDGILGGKL